MEMLVAQMIFLQSSHSLIWVEVTPYISIVVAMHGENCTERLLYTYSTLPTPIVTESVVTMETGSVLVTPTVSSQMTPTSFLVTPTPDIGVGNGVLTFQLYPFHNVRFAAPSL